MNSEYENTKTEIVREITSHKVINKYRNFMNSLDEYSKQMCFLITLKYIDNEYNNPTIAVDEKNLLFNLKNHWQLNIFNKNPDKWWSDLLFIYFKSTSLMTVIHMWIR